MEKDEMRKNVRKGYAEVAKREGSCCSQASCCGDPTKDMSRVIGYTDQEIGSVPDGANLGLGCGNPTALASLREGETVIDLGSGGGFDCFLAANKVGDGGRVIGVDMTPEMLDKARENARKGNYRNVEFRLGEIENLPIADEMADVVISNCVINLSPDKHRVFREAFRALKPGGRLMVSDMVLTRELPEKVKSSIEYYVGCIAGAAMKEDYLSLIRETGFEDVKIIEEKRLSHCADDPIAVQMAEKSDISTDELEVIANSVASVTVYGRKPN